MHGVLRLLVLLAMVWPAAALATAAQVSFSGPRSAALAGATSAVPDDVRGESNPASWGYVRRWSLVLSAVQLYEMPELRFASAALLAPVRRGAVTVAASTFGYELYGEGSIDAGIARRVGAGSFRKISIGLRVRRRHVRFARYGHANASGFSAGIHLPVTPVLALGAVAHDVVVLGSFREEVPRRLALGASYRPGGTFGVSVDVQKEVRSPISAATGVEVSLVPQLVLRGGAASSPARIAFGTGIRLSHLEADAAAVRHEVLGWTPSVSILLTW